MKIQVTEEDVRVGLPMSGEECPVARAMQRATGETWTVSTRYAFLKRPDQGTVTVRLPREVRQFTAAFDMDEPVAPLEFEFPNAW